jgi:Protein of unknown function (DUF1488)
MPLFAIARAAELDVRRMAIGFWMGIEGARPFKPVRVFVAFDLLYEMDTSQPGSPSAALAIFDAKRARIEAIASDRFDNNGVDDGDFGGQPILVVRGEDFPSVSSNKAVEPSDQGIVCRASLASIWRAQVPIIERFPLSRDIFEFLQ